MFVIAVLVTEFCNAETRRDPDIATINAGLVSSSFWHILLASISEGSAVVSMRMTPNSSPPRRPIISVVLSCWESRCCQHLNNCVSGGMTVVLVNPFEVIDVPHHQGRGLSCATEAAELLYEAVLSITAVV